MTSYLGIETLREPMLEYNMPNLLDLIWLTLRSQGLQIKDFFHAGHREYVMAALDPLLKPEALQKVEQSEKDTLASDVPRRTCSRVFPSFVMYLRPIFVQVLETSAQPTPDACTPRRTTAEKTATAARIPDRKIARS